MTNLVEKRFRKPPFFSICIPQYNRTSFLLEALESFRKQTFSDFEVCVSDDRSTDARGPEIVRFLKSSGMKFAYWKNPKNLRYDGNLRQALSLARGRYCLLMGNDDAFQHERVLETIQAAIERHSSIGAVLNNYQNADDLFKYRRVQATGDFGGGPETALRHFRDFSFVSGVCLLREAAHRHATDQWDGSEMYQVYLACRILSEGHRLLGIDDNLILRGIQIRGESVDSYAKKAADPRARKAFSLPLTRLAPLVSNAIHPFLPPSRAHHYCYRLCRDLLFFTYLYWLFDYRKVASWGYAVRVASAMRPTISVRSVPLKAFDRLKLWGLFVGVTVVGLTFPKRLFFGLYPLLHRTLKGRSAARCVSSADEKRAA